MRVLALLFIINAALSFPASANMQNEAAVILNEYRSSKGRHALVPNQILIRAAQGHADDMANKGYFSHRSRNGDTMTRRIKKAGFKPCGSVAENIARGQQSVDAVMQAWINSPSHRRNNLHRKVTHFGLGHSNGYWVITFAQICK